MDYDRRKAEFAMIPALSAGGIGRGVLLAANTGVYPISLETASNRMQLNLDGTVTMQCGETEIGQGADTAYAQMTAKAVGLKSYKDVHVVSCQDTDITPTGLGAYASRQTYMEGFAIDQTGRLLRQKILAYAAEMLGCSAEELDIVEGNVVRKDNGAVEMDLSHLAMTAQYNPVHSEHITAESTATIRSNAYSFGCTFAEVEVDIPMCKVTLKRIIVNVRDCGSLINPALAGGTGPWRYVHGHRLRPFRTAAVRRKDRQAPEQQPAGLQAVHRDGPSGSGGLVCGERGADLSLWNEGSGRAPASFPGAGHPQCYLQRHRRFHRYHAHHPPCAVPRIQGGRADP